MKNYSETPDGVLVELTLLGSDDAFEELVTRHQKAVVGTAYKVTGNKYSAEDASQDAFVAAWLGLSSLGDHAKFRSWVCAIARNSALEILRGYRDAARTISLDTDLLRGEIPDCEWEDFEAGADLRAALDKLSAKIREAVELHYFEGYSIEEIAARLSIPAGTVKWRLSEGRRQLRKGYGIMEKEYDDKEALVDRVMREVEQLKLWKLKNDHTGFEAEYRRVLKSVEALDDSERKEYALADVMMMGYWWIEGERSDEVLDKIKRSAEISRNEDVMNSVLVQELNKRNHTLSSIREFDREASAYLDGLGLKNTKAFIKNHLGMLMEYYGSPAEAERLFGEGLALSGENDLEHAFAAASLKVLKDYQNDMQGEKAYLACGYLYKKINGRDYLWSGRAMFCGSRQITINEEFDPYNVFAWHFESLINYPGIKAGDEYKQKFRNTVVTSVSDGEIYVTSAGTFTDCIIVTADVEDRVPDGRGPDRYNLVTVFAEGLGIVEQRIKREFYEVIVSLSEYEVKGSGIKQDSRTVLGADRYVYGVDCSVPFKISGQTELTVVCENADSAVISEVSVTEAIYPEATWEDVFVKITNRFADYANKRFKRSFDPDLQPIGKPESIIEDMKKLTGLASTNEQKVKSETIRDVLTRIFTTDGDEDPNRGKRAFTDEFIFRKVFGKNGTVVLDKNPKQGQWILSEQYHNGYGFPSETIAEWLKTHYTDIYEILFDGVGCLWSDEWKPGFEFEKEYKYYNEYDVKLRFYVKEDETVKTPAGTFENCRHIRFDLAGLPSWRVGNRGSWMDFWFAPGVGIVQYFRLIFNKIDMFWQLTDYRGTGDGYFPICDGLWRRYEPTDVKRGYHAFAEYTFCDGEGGMELIRNSSAWIERDSYEKAIREAAEKAKAE